MIEVSDAVMELKRYIKTCTSYVEKSIEDAVGYVTYEDIYAPINVPTFPKSAMDGYAVRAQDVEFATKDTPVTLRVIGELFAGDFRKFDVCEGTAVRVMTGSYIPEGYDAVIKQEDTDYGSECVKIYSRIAAYRNYCKIGEDIKEGQLIIEKNTVLHSLHIGLLASLGINSVKVKKPMRVSVISTGSELLSPSQELIDGKIYNSISYILSSEIKGRKGEIVRSIICPDSEDEIQRVITESVLDSDVVITTGGVSVGKKDLLMEVLDSMQAKRIFKGLNIQPGTPTMASVYNDTVILSLSGNPFAAYANFQLFFWEIFAEYMCNKQFLNKKKCAILKSEYNKTSGLRRLVRAYEDDGVVVIPDDVHASSVISNMTRCNCFVDIKADTKISIGDTVDIIKLSSI